MSHHSFFLGPNKIKAIHQMFPYNNQHNTRFEILAAFLCRCRTKALQLDPEQEVRFICVCNARTKSNTSFVPHGYYGNAILHPTVATTARKLCENSLGYALELVKKAKAEATAEYLQSMADLTVIRGRPGFALTRSSWLLSDLTQVGLSDADFGWGKAIYGGPTKDGSGALEISHCIACKNAEGEAGIVVQFYLPPKAMKMFVEELDSVLGNNNS